MEKDQNDERLNQAASSSSNSGKNRFELIKWSGVTMWSWDIAVDNCAICRNHVMAHCLECQSDQKPSDDDGCTVAWGACKHAFHLHCISRWIKTRNVCPLDNSPWEYMKIGK